MATRMGCSVEECDRPHYGHGMCNTHWKRWRKHGDAKSGRAISSPAVFTGSEKQCTNCRCLLPLADFNKNPQSRSGLHQWCKDCQREGRRELYRREPERMREYSYWAGIKSRFKLTREQYEAKQAAQQGVCAICSEPQPDRRLSVDHDHACCPGSRSCGVCVRDLLCVKCNSLLGLANDDPDRLLAAVDYLRKWSKSRT